MYISSNRQFGDLVLKNILLFSGTDYLYRIKRFRVYIYTCTVKGDVYTGNKCQIKTKTKKKMETDGLSFEIGGRGEYSNT